MGGQFALFSIFFFVPQRSVGGVDSSATLSVMCKELLFIVGNRKLHRQVARLVESNTVYSYNNAQIIIKFIFGLPVLNVVCINRVNIIPK